MSYDILKCRNQLVFCIVYKASYKVWTTGMKDESGLVQQIDRILKSCVDSLVVT